jgi:hypothetical protein
MDRHAARSTKCNIKNPMGSTTQFEPIMNTHTGHSCFDGPGLTMQARPEQTRPDRIIWHGSRVREHGSNQPKTCEGLLHYHTSVIAIKGPRMNNLGGMCQNGPDADRNLKQLLLTHGHAMTNIPRTAAHQLKQQAAGLLRQSCQTSSGPPSPR